MKACGFPDGASLRLNCSLTASVKNSLREMPRCAECALACRNRGSGISTILFTDVLAANLQQPPLGIADLFEGQLPFVVIAFAGVGLFIRRTFPGSTHRLGLVRPAWWHVAPVLGGG